MTNAKKKKKDIFQMASESELMLEKLENKSICKQHPAAITRYWYLKMDKTICKMVTIA